MEHNFKGRALNYNVVVLPKKLDNVTATGIDVSAMADKNDRYRAGQVVSIGNLCPPYPEGHEKAGEPVIRIGDTILFDKNKYSDYTQDGVEYWNVSFADLFLNLSI